MKASELREKSIEELKSSLSDARRQQFKIRLMKGSGELAHFHTIKAKRQEIARLCTILAEKQALETKEGKK